MSHGAARESGVLADDLDPHALQVRGEHEAIAPIGRVERTHDLAAPWERAGKGPPDDALLTAVLAKHFIDRGITPPARLIPYLVTRIERSLAAAGQIVADLDAAALREGRAPSVQLAGRLLDTAAQKDA